jgi:hypothetical protein
MIRKQYKLNQLGEWPEGIKRSKYWADNMGETGDFSHDIHGNMNENMYGTGFYGTPTIAQCASNF